MRKKRDRKRERRLKKGNKNNPYREVLCLRRLPLSGAQHLEVRRLQKRVEVRQEPLLALVQSFLRGSGLVEPRGQRLAGAREAEELKVALDPGPDRGEVMRGRSLDGGGHAVEEVRGLWGGADGGWWWWCGGWKDRFEKVGGERSRKKKSGEERSRETFLFPHVPINQHQLGGDPAERKGAKCIHSWVNGSFFLVISQQRV